LFICGGAFEGLDRVVERRVRESTIGFRATPTSKITDTAERARLLHQTTPDDLMKYGFIPEFIGRLPVLASLDPLDESAMIRILTEPRNALTKQYQKLLAADGVELIFQSNALTEISREAMQRKTGARALRSILEETMTNVMFDVPSLAGVAQCVISENTIQQKTDPILITRSQLLAEAREKSGEKSKTAEVETLEMFDAGEPAEAA
jgi:ATP-dependent Clp protease ATP-binding subunit ClpX